MDLARIPSIKAEALNNFKENDGGKIPESVPLLEDVFADTHSDSKNVLKILKRKMLFGWIRMLYTKL